MERKICYILDASNRDEWRVDARLTPPAPNPTADNQWARTFIDRGRKPHVETVQLPLPTVFSDYFTMCCFPKFLSHLLLL